MAVRIPLVYESTATDSSCNDPVLLDDWHVVALSTEVEAAQVMGARLLGRELVIWRDSSQQAHVWEDLCIHRGSRLSKGWVSNDALVCPYHGWHYDCSAKCVLMPATPNQVPPLKARAFAYRAVERYGFIWASLGNPSHDIPVFPEWDDDRFVKVHAGGYLWKSSGFRAVENFTDITHFPWVHAGVNGVSSTPDRIDDYQVSVNEGGISSTEIPVFQPYGDPRNVPVYAGYSYRVMRPLVAYFSKRVAVAEPDDRYPNHPDDRFCTYFTAQPLDDVTCIIRICTARNFSPDLTAADVLRRQDLVYTQDRDIVETQRPERIPVDLREELHHRTDRFGQEYRRWLRSLGVVYGTV